MYIELDKFLANWKEQLLKWYEGMKLEYRETPSTKKMLAKFPELSKTDLTIIRERPLYKTENLSQSIQELLDKDFAQKRSRLIAKIESKLETEIEEVRLHCEKDGNFNGFIKDSKGNTVVVDTILAGGYNIQKLHYRVLVKGGKNK